MLIELVKIKQILNRQVTEALAQRPMQLNKITKADIAEATRIIKNYPDKR
jgi:hypothetical protein